MAVDLAFDESGRGSTLLVSMQLSSAHRAKKLKKQWKRTLPPSVPFFHSKDFWNYSGGVFEGQSREERDKLLGKLSTFIKRHISIGFTSVIDVDAYNRRTTQDFRSRWGTAYSFSINMLLLASHIYCELYSLGNDINILIASGHRHGAQPLAVC